MLKREEIEEMRIKFNEYKESVSSSALAEDYAKLLTHAEEMQGMMERIARDFTQLQAINTERSKLIRHLVELMENELNKAKSEGTFEINEIIETFDALSKVGNTESDADVG